MLTEAELEGELDSEKWTSVVFNMDGQYPSGFKIINYILSAPSGTELLEIGDDFFTARGFQTDNQIVLMFKGDPDLIKKSIGFVTTMGPRSSQGDQGDQEALEDLISGLGSEDEFSEDWLKWDIEEIMTALNYYLGLGPLVMIHH